MREQIKALLDSYQPMASWLTGCRRRLPQPGKPDAKARWRKLKEEIKEQVVQRQYDFDNLKVDLSVTAPSDHRGSRWVHEGEAALGSLARCLARDHGPTSSDI